jgi:hypothetical protein
MPSLTSGSLLLKAALESHGVIFAESRLLKTPVECLA